MSFPVHFLIYAITIFHLINYGNSLQNIKIFRQRYSQNIQTKCSDSITVLKSSESNDIKSLPRVSNKSTAPSVLGSKKTAVVSNSPSSVKIISDDEKELQIATLIG